MALSASAMPFVMPAGFEEDAKLTGKEEIGACSTAAPSPALTAGSPPFSPWDSPANGPFVGGAWGHSQLGWLAAPPLSLPELDPAAEEESVSFELSGLASLQTSLASVLAKHISAQADPRSRSGSYDLPPGLTLPPGLAPPPGLEELQSEPTAELAPKELAKEFLVLPANCTTVMLRNIPNKYSRERLAAQLKEDGFGSDVDFLYLPIDFRNKCNVGYAFLSFRTAEACARFAMQYHLRNATDKLPGFKSKKVCEVSEARCQGREENVRRLQASQVMQQLVGRPEWLPLLFDADGQVEDFPMPKIKLAAPLPTPVPVEASKSSGRSSRRRSN